MRQATGLLLAVLVLLFAASATAQVTGGTGKLGFQLRNYGAIRLNTPVYTGGTRQMDRMNLVAALDSNNVFDHEQDANTVQAASRTVGGFADTIATVLADNTYSNLPPNINARTTVYAWHNDDFLIVKFTVKNIFSAAYKLYLGAFVIPHPSNAYGGEIVAYDATKKVGYFYRPNETPYIGVKLLGGDPYSFHALDWDQYSPDPVSDSAKDGTRWRMTALPGFDASLTGGANGSAYNLNAGARTIAPGDSATVYYALIFATSLTSLQAASDAAVTRYAGKFTSVMPSSDGIPEHFALAQNYPNPFNPATRIGFQIKTAAFTTLKVYNMLGSEVATLVSNELAPGSYEVPFVANDLSSGVYVYRLTAGTYVETRRMMLMK